MALDGHHGVAKIPKLVWTLACVGMGAGLLVMGIEFRALTIVDQQHEWAKATEERATRSFQSLRLERLAVFRDMEYHLTGISDSDEPPRRNPISLNSLVAQCVAELVSLEGDKSANLATAEVLRKAFTSLSVIHDDLERYDVDHLRTGDQLRDSWATQQTKIVETRESADKLEGRQRLRHQLMLRKYRKADKEDIAQVATTYIDGMESVRDLRTFSFELNELTLLAERLHGENEIDQLVSLKDNEIRQTLMRLYYAAHRADKGSREVITSHIDSLMAVMFGEGAVDDKAHQTLILGEGGLFQCKLQSLLLKAEHGRLRKRLTVRLDACLEAERAFDLALSAAAEVNAIRAKTVFRKAWRDTLITGAIVAMVFLVLSWRLARLGKEAEEQLRSKNKSLEKAMDELEIAATTDKLTGLPNRVVFLDRLESLLTRSKSDEGVRFGILFFDFDRFKVVNDSLGHEIGDALLRDIAKILRRLIRGSDIVARFGGDEFVILLGDLTHWEDAEIKAKRLLDVLAAPHQLGDHLVVSTASIGLVTNERKYEYPGDMVRDADAAMYQAKEYGKAQVVVFDRVMHKHALERLSLESDLRAAVTTNEDFRLVYQPIIELKTGRIDGFEALIRWMHPEHGMINPVDFITIAEDTGMINSIGLWVLRTAASQLADWNNRREQNHKLKINVNVSKRQLMAPEFLDEVLECRRDYDLHPGELCLEITESTIADHRSDVVPLLTKLRGHGFPIVMDDFGTGVSSLSTLHECPIDVLKIDQAFIRVLNRDRSLLAVVMSITSLAENLGIQTVAEGIETEDIVGALQSIDCTWGQGYYFAKPLSATDAEAFLVEHQNRWGTNAA